MSKLTPFDIVNAISTLGKKPYDYISGKGEVEVVEIVSPAGPIKLLRQTKPFTVPNKTKATLSQNQIAIAASAFSRRPNYPIHFDRLFSGSGNSRSVFETLLALTPNFFICFPKIVNPDTGEIKDDLKHLMYCPDEVHKLGEFETKEYIRVISKVELEFSFNNIDIQSSALGTDFDSIEAKRMHTQIQLAIIEIGKALSFKTWIAKNDQSIIVGDKKIIELDGVLNSLSLMNIFYSPQIKKSAELIDCIWFSGDGDYVPAIIEVEHSTGVTSGLTRMAKFKENMPSINTRFVIVAPDELRYKVISEANTRLFKSLNVYFMPYSTIKELYGLVQKYSLSSFIDRKFIEPFMEKVTE